jgi:hypothetical protein
MHPNKWQYIPFTVDHIILLSKDGARGIENLALACFNCNRQKSDKLSAIDLDTGEEVPLFNPCVHSWHQHFIWSKDASSIRTVNSYWTSNCYSIEF